MSSTRTMGISVTDVDTAAVLPLGFEYHEPASSDDQGAKVWIYVFIDDAASFIQGRIVMRDAGTATADGILTTAGTLISTHRLLGVAQHTIAAASYGFILRRGIGEVMAGNGAVIGADTALTSAGTTTAGTALDFSAGTTATDCVFAFSTEASTGLNGLATCMINCLG